MLKNNLMSKKINNKKLQIIQKIKKMNLLDLLCKKNNFKIKNNNKNNKEI